MDTSCDFTDFKNIYDELTDTNINTSILLLRYSIAIMEPLSLLQVHTFIMHELINFHFKTSGYILYQLLKMFYPDIDSDDNKNIYLINYRSYNLLCKNNVTVKIPRFNKLKKNSIIVAIFKLVFCNYYKLSIYQMKKIKNIKRQNMISTLIEYIKNDENISENIFSNLMLKIFKIYHVI